VVGIGVAGIAAVISCQNAKDANRSANAMEEQLTIERKERVAKPQVKLIMPEEEVRLAQDQRSENAFFVRIYLQPTFYIANRSQRTERLYPLYVYVTPQEEEAQCTQFRLSAIGSLTPTPEGGTLVFTHERAVSPLVVTQEEQADNVLAFSPPREESQNPRLDPHMREKPYFVGTHNYLITLVAGQMLGQKKLMGTIKVTTVSGTYLIDKAQRKKRSDARKPLFVTFPAEKAITPSYFESGPTSSPKCLE
jgi:hypothetical protein